MSLCGLMTVFDPRFEYSGKKRRASGLMGISKSILGNDHLSFRGEGNVRSFGLPQGALTYQLDPKCLG